MAILKIDSLSSYDQNIIVLNGGKFDNWRDEGTITMDGSYGRNSTPGLRLITNSRQTGARGNVSVHLDANYETIIVGAAVRIDSDNQFSMAENLFNSDKVIFSILDGSVPQASLCVTPSMRLRVKAGESGLELGRSSFYIHENVYYYIEFKCSIATSGVFSVRVDGTSRLTGTGTTQSTANQRGNGVRLGSESSKPQTIAGRLIRFDDLYINAVVAGSANNDFMGDVMVEVRTPIGDGPVLQWSQSTSGTLHYPTIDDSTPNTIDYVRAGTVGYTDLYLFSGVTVPSGSILAVQPNIYARKTTAGVVQISPVMSRQGTLTAGDDVNYLTQEYKYHRSNVWNKRIDDSSQWELDFANSVYFGMKRVG